MACTRQLQRRPWAPRCEGQTQGPVNRRPCSCEQCGVRVLEGRAGGRWQLEGGLALLSQVPQIGTGIVWRTPGCLPGSAPRTVLPCSCGGALLDHLQVTAEIVASHS